MLVMQQIVRPFRGVSADERRDTRRAQLLEACLDVVGTCGIAGTTIDGICRSAGLTKRYFYESFPSRNDAFAALADELIADITEKILAAFPNDMMDLRDRIHCAIDSVTTLLFDDPRSARFFSEVIGKELLKDTVGPAEHRIAQLLIELILAGREITKSQHDRMQLAALVIVTGSVRAFTSWLDGRISISREDLVDEITEMSVAAARSIRSDL